MKLKMKWFLYYIIMTYYLQPHPHLSEGKRVHHLAFRRERYAVAGVQHPLRIVFQKANRFRKLLILFQQMESADDAGNRFMPAHSQCLQHNIADSTVGTAGNDEHTVLPLICKGRNHPSQNRPARYPYIHQSVPRIQRK